MFIARTFDRQLEVSLIYMLQQELSCFGFFDYFAWNKENGKNWDHWVGTL